MDAAYRRELTVSQIDSVNSLQWKQSSFSAFEQSNSLLRLSM